MPGSDHGQGQGGIGEVDAMTQHELPSLRNLGMYDAPSAGVQVGEFNIRPQRDGWIWIECASGEGFECETSLLEAAVREFYGKHF